MLQDQDPHVWAAPRSPYRPPSDTLSPLPTAHSHRRSPLRQLRSRCWPRDRRCRGGRDPERLARPRHRPAGASGATCAGDKGPGCRFARAAGAWGGVADTRAASQEVRRQRSGRAGVTHAHVFEQCGGRDSRDQQTDNAGGVQVVLWGGRRVEV